MQRTKITFLISFIITIKVFQCKYLEGVLKTHDNWVFLARFCFLSEKGQFEYHFEFNEAQGYPNLLLYYDTSDQWPSVYKTDKTCREKEAVLKVAQLQMVNLTVIKDYERVISGCDYQTRLPTTHTPKYTLKFPTRRPPATVRTTETTTNDSSYEPNETTTAFVDSNQTFDFSPSRTESPIVKRSLPNRASFYEKIGHRTIICRNSRSFRSARERWWFIALSNCDGKGISVSYRLLMTNGQSDDFWRRHFSADEFYILPVLLAFTIGYSILLMGVVLCSIELKSRQLLHTTYKIFVCSVVCEFFAVMFTSGTYLKYATNGVAPNKIKRFGQVLMGLSESLYLLLLLLLAKGFTVTRGRLRIGASVKLTVFMCLYAITYISIFVYESNVFDPGLVLYLYESPAGYGIILLRTFAWFMFVYSSIFTLKHYPDKVNFYYPFAICGTLWFLAGPIFILSANTYIDKWVRESVVCAVLQFITFGGHLVFLILTMPSVANKNFPFHVRTSQIGIWQPDGEVGSIEHFAQHAYQPSAPNQLSIVPLTRRTEEIYEGMYTNGLAHALPPRQALLSGVMGEENGPSWALAKNLADLGSRPFSNRFSVSSDGSNYEEISRRPSLEYSNGVNYEEVERDVPVELFTVCKMAK